MASILPVTAMPLLLLVCGPLLHQASAAATLEEIAMIVGAYSNADQMAHELEKYHEFVNDDVTLLYQPLDIPALNQHFPLLFEETVNGNLCRRALVLFHHNADIDYYNVTDFDKYRSGKLNMADITQKDLLPVPMCRGKTLTLDDEVIVAPECQDSNWNLYHYVCVHTCTTMTSTAEERGPEKYMGVSYSANKIQRFPLPDSWLKGREDFVNPCCVC